MGGSAPQGKAFIADPVGRLLATRVVETNAMIVVEKPPTSISRQHAQPFIDK